MEVLILGPDELGLRSSKEEGPKAAKISNELGNGAQVMGDFHLVLSRGDRGEGEVWGLKATRAAATSPWIIDQVRVKFFAENGASYLVTGDQGMISAGKKNSNDVQVKGHVVTHSSNGYVFRTELANYESYDRVLLSPGKVDVVGPPDANHNSLTVVGENMVADLSSNIIEIKRNVHAKKSVRDNKLANITSRRAIFSGKSNAVKFLDDVVIDVETLRITGREAAFNYKPGTDLIDTMVISGGSRVTDSDKLATAEKVTVHFDDDRYVFSGSPRVVQNGDELVGDEIMFLNGGKQVKVSNAHAKIEQEDLEKNRPKKAEKK
jgi:lipopolysaccharide export system protein LptA